MELKDIKALIDLMKKNDLSVFKMQNEGFKITLKKGTEGVVTTSIAAPALVAATPLAAAPVAAAAAAAETKPATPGREIVSPMVGTFYRSPAPDSPPFVDVGDEVTEETVVCIIEAMKVMNEIKAECRGTILEVAAEVGKPVQFGQALFRVK